MKGTFSLSLATRLKVLVLYKLKNDAQFERTHLLFILAKLLVISNLQITSQYYQRRKWESACLPALVANSMCWQWEKAFHLSSFEYIQLFSSTGSNFSCVPSGSFCHATGHRAHRGWCPCVLLSSHLSFLPPLTARLKPSPPVTHRDLDRSFALEVLSSIHLVSIY